MQLKFKDFNFRSDCAVSTALDIVGDKWTLIIVRDALLLGSTSFGEFRSCREKIASNILTSRLEKLVKHGIMTKTNNLHHKLKFDYKLTEMGLELKPIILALGSWCFKNVEGTNDPEVEVKKYLDKLAKENTKKT
jgi:DNA-binding HxlR family transcriptional regulator